MNKYSLRLYQYSTSADRLTEVKADEVKFEGLSVNFYKKDRLIYSCPAAITAIYEIKYKK
jgi:hypothetical protein